MARDVRRLTDAATEEGAAGVEDRIEYEEVPVRKLDRGDWVLLRPDERMPRDGVLVAVLADDASDSTDDPTCDVETDDGEVETRRIDDEIGRDETVRRRSVVVEITESGGILWWLWGAGAALGRAGVVIVGLALVLGVSLAGTGLGDFNPVTLVTDNTRSPGPTDDGDPDSPPPVEADPPGSDAGSGDGGDGSVDSDPSDGGDGSDAGDTEGSDGATSDGNDDATGSDDDQVFVGGGSGGGGGGGGSGGGGSAGNAEDGSGSPPVEASISMTAADPPRYRNADGRLGTVEGRLDGSVSWTTGRVDGVVLVIQTFVPGVGWAEIDRVSVTPAAGQTAIDSPLDLNRTLGEVAYANASRSGGFENPDPNTTRVTEGRAAVTAVLYDGETEVARTTANDTFDVTVRHVDFDLELGPDPDNSDINESLLSARGVAPSDEWVNRGQLTNAGAVSGAVELTNVTYTSYENGQTEPEAAVDDTTGIGAGELQNALEARIYVTSTDGTGDRRYVFGNETTYRPFVEMGTETVRIASLEPDETVTIAIEYRVDGAAGNEIQSDSLRVDFGFTMVEVG